MTHEPVRMVKTLKVGHGSSQKIWLEGEIITPPLPTEILNELMRNSGICFVVGEEPRPNFGKEIQKRFKPNFENDRDPFEEAIIRKRRDIL